MKVEIEVDEDDGTMRVVIEPDGGIGGWTYSDEYDRLDITIPKKEAH